MAVVGSAFVVVRAIGKGIASDVAKSMKGLDKIGASAGARSGASFKRAFAKVGVLDWSKIFSDAQAARERFQSLIRVGNTLSSAIVGLVGGIGALVGGLVALGGALLSATPSAAALLGGLTALGAAAIAARLALSGIGQAVAALNKQQGGAARDTTAAVRREQDARRNLARVIERNAESLAAANRNITRAAKDLTDAQEELNEALEDGAEQLQQLGFEAEDAALAEQRAAVELERARENLLRVQDLPPNSRARREAELAFAEADLNLRRAKDRNADLAKEQERLAETGVEGLDSVIAARETVAQAEERLQEARDERAKTVRDNARAQADAERQIERAIEDRNKAAAGGGTDPLAGLTPSQRDFAIFLAGLKPLIDELKESVAKELLPRLTTAITTVVDGAFEVVKTGLSDVAAGLGDAAIEFANTIVDPENLLDLEGVFDLSADIIRNIGGIFSGVYDSVLSIINAADPITRKFFDFLEKKSKDFAAFLDTKQATGELEEFFNQAGEIAAQIGEILGNAFGGIVGIVKANTGPGSGGQILLDYLEGVTSNFEKFANSPEARDFFADIAKNAQSVLQAVGAFVKEILILGANPNIGIFFDQLAKAAPILGSIAGKFADALPSFGELILSVLEFIDIFTQTEQITAFFDTLRGAIDIVNNIFRNEFVAGILDAVAPIIGALSAIGLIFDVIKFALLVVAGNILLTIAAWKSFLFIGGKIFAFLGKIGGLFLNLARVVIPIVINGLRLLGAAFMANPIGFIIGLIALLVTAFITAYQSSETFRNIVNNALGAVRDFFVAAWEVILGAVQGVWNWLSENWPLILAILTGPIGLAVKFIIDNWDAIVAFVKKIPGRIKAALTGAWDFIVSALSTAYTKVQEKITDIVEFVKGLPDKFTRGAGKIWDFLIEGLKGAWQLAKNWWNTNIGGKGFGIKVPDWIPGFLGGGKTFDIRIPKLAQGGVVMPRPGGTLAQIAEAGRPERVEPLDPDGLSRRDKAIIRELSAGSGGGGMTFNIYPSQGMDETELANMVSRKVAFMMRRGAVA